MRSQCIIREYENGAREVIDTIRYHRKVIYHNANRRNKYSNGDTVWFVNEKVVAVCPNDGAKIVYDDLYSVLPLDYIQFPYVSEAAQDYLNKQEVMINLRNNPHHYDAMIARLMQCTVCNGAGETWTHDDEEGQFPVASPCEKCKGKQPVITDEIIRNYFKLPKPQNKEMDAAVKKNESPKKEKLNDFKTAVIEMVKGKQAQ